MPMFEIEFLKNGSTFLNNTSSPTRGEYFLYLNLFSELDALVGEAGIPRNIH